MKGKEKEAIETMQHWIDYEKANKEKINKADELIEIQETVLNLIQTQQEEIERLKQTELNAKGGAVKITLEGLLELKAETEKKDKIIDEMAEQIYDEWYIPNIKTIDDVKEYFINKVEKESKDDN